MARRARFVLWCLAVAEVQAVHWLGAGRWAVVGGLLVIVVLLGTTPAGAIRLGRGISEMLILVGSIRPDWNGGGHGGGDGGWVWVHLCIVLVMLFILRLWGKSAWWAVLFAWF